MRLNNNQEVWKDIPDYKNLYQISNFGRVKSLERLIYRKNGNYIVKEKILKNKTNTKGYLSISMCKNGKVKYVMIHRLVAQAFIPNPNNFPCINHKDENKQNNCVENLEWCTYSYNNTYNNRHYRCWETRKAK